MAAGLAAISPKKSVAKFVLILMPNSSHSTDADDNHRRVCSHGGINPRVYRWSAVVLRRLTTRYFKIVLSSISELKLVAESVMDSRFVAKSLRDLFRINPL